MSHLQERAMPATGPPARWYIAVAPMGRSYRTLVFASFFATGQSARCAPGR